NLVTSAIAGRCGAGHGRASALDELCRPERGAAWGILIDQDLVAGRYPLRHEHGAGDAIAFQINSGLAAALLVDRQCGELAILNKDIERATGIVGKAELARIGNPGHGEREV